MLADLDVSHCMVLGVSIIVTPEIHRVGLCEKNGFCRDLSEVFGLKSYPQYIFGYAKPNMAIGSRVRAFRL
jgi:hypothetical protein